MRRLIRLIIALVLVLVVMQRARDERIYQAFFPPAGTPFTPPQVRSDPPTSIRTVPTSK